MKAGRRLLAVSAGLAGPLWRHQGATQAPRTQTAQPHLGCRMNRFPPPQPCPSSFLLLFTPPPLPHLPPPDPDRVSVSRPPPSRLCSYAIRRKFALKRRPFVWPCVCCASRREGGWLGWGGVGGVGGQVGRRVLANVCRLTFPAKSLPRVQQSVSLLHHHRRTSGAPRTSAPRKHRPDVRFFSVSLLWQQPYTLIN